MRIPIFNLYLLMTVWVLTLIGTPFSVKGELCGITFIPTDTLPDIDHWQKSELSPSQEILLTHLKLYPNCQHEEELMQLIGGYVNQEMDHNIASIDVETYTQNMIFLKGEHFEMGHDKGRKSEQPTHVVLLDDFYINKYEVTFAEYDKFCRATKRKMAKDKGWGRGNQPVINVSWHDAIAFCNWLSVQHNLEPVYSKNQFLVKAKWKANGYRLPTEAEWEFAARSKGIQQYWSGTSNQMELITFANFSGEADGYKHTAPVGSFKANEIGIFDMSGNVYEWCWDWYDPTYYSNWKRIVNPRGAKTGKYRVVRGGSWYSEIPYLHCFHRYYGFSVNQTHNVGFRLARSAN